MKVGKSDLLLLLIVAALPAHSDPSRDTAAEDRFACEALKAMDLSEPTGAGVRLADVGLLPASADQPAASFDQI